MDSTNYDMAVTFRLPSEDVRLLDATAKKQRTSRASLLRGAVLEIINPGAQS